MSSGKQPCKFTDQLSSSLSALQPHSHSHDHDLGDHDHDHGSSGPGSFVPSLAHDHEGSFTPLEHGHTHEHLEDAGMMFASAGSTRSSFLHPY